MTPVRISHYPRRDGPLPDGARYVGRPSRWGNPFRVTNDRTGYTAAQAVEEYRAAAVVRDRLDPDWLEPLRTATALACACPLDQPCHGDVLLELLAASR